MVAVLVFCLCQLSRNAVPNPALAYSQVLAEMSDDSLKDIGLTRADVEHERHRSVWNDPLGK
nr:DUF1127 domain-containing protein [Pseudomonas sp. WS 5411]